MSANPLSCVDHVVTAADIRAPEWRYNRIRVPRTDQSYLCEPNFAAAVSAIAHNAQQLNTSDTCVAGRPLGDVRQWAREESLAAAHAYTSGLLGRPVEPVAHDGVVVSGHQPSLFHPGVWVKNFALNRLSEQSGAVGLNLVVDNDTHSKAEIVAPCTSPSGVVQQPIPFDRIDETRPWEGAPVVDTTLFRSFASRVETNMREWSISPVVRTMWPAAIRALSAGRSRGDCLTAARAELERRWGLRNLELPISRLCQLDPFCWFAAHLFAHLPRFRDDYNRVVREFRRYNRIRSSTHPVPELSSRDDWIEAPFWVWQTGAAKRQRVFCRRIGETVELSDGHREFARFDAKENDGTQAAETLGRLPQQGICLRTRALTTTLFARLFLGDLFVHGIGGAKYDEMNDHLIFRFFGLQPPRYLTLSGTLHLPIAGPKSADSADALRLKAAIRDVHYNPQRYVQTEHGHQLATQKQSLVDEQTRGRTAGDRRERRQRRTSNYHRFLEIQRLNESLRAETVTLEQRLHDELRDVQEQLATRQVLEDREFAFCLYPKDSLRRFVRGIDTV